MSGKNRLPSRLFDLREVMDRIGGDKDFLAEIVEVFVADYPNQILSIREALAAGDAHIVERRAHSLKGAVGNFAATEAYDRAYELEKLGRAGDLTRAATVLASLEDALGELKDSLERAIAD